MTYLVFLLGKAKLGQVTEMAVIFIFKNGLGNYFDAYFALSRMPNFS